MQPGMSGSGFEDRGRTRCEGNWISRATVTLFFFFRTRTRQQGNATLELQHRSLWMVLIIAYIFLPIYKF
jgi:hypothetical protein